MSDRSSIFARAFAAVELRSKAIENGMITLRGSGLQKIRDGVTTIDEVVRETVL